MSLERIYRRLTGVNPRIGLQPPLQGAALQKEVRRLRHPSERAEQLRITGYGVHSTGTIGLGDPETYTVLQRFLSDGSTQVCCLTGNLTEKEAKKIGPTLGIENWASPAELFGSMGYTNQ